MSMVALMMNGFVWRVGGVATLLILVLALYLQSKSVGRLQEQVRALSHAANDNAVLVNQMRLAMEHADAASAQVAHASQSAHRKFAARKQEITDASALDDGSVAPVLLRVLDSLPGSDGDTISLSKSGIARERNSVPGRP